MDSSVKEARERFAECWAHMSENHKRMIEDIRFSNPADPQQWDRIALRDRGSRPILTFDQSNQYIAQVVNDARQNKPSMKVRPVDDKADVKAAKALNGILYHIQDASRADIAYDTAIESAARIGLGWIRVDTEIVNPQTKEKEIRIRRVHDFRSGLLDDGSTEPDGSDAMDGFMIATVAKDRFRKDYKDAAVLSFDEEGWYGSDSVRVADYFKVEEKMMNYIITTMEDGTRRDLEEKEYWAYAKEIGSHPPYHGTYMETKRIVTWTKLSGQEELESTTFPGIYVPLVPVIGNEIFLEGKRYLCGMVRKGMDAQRAYNYARSTEVELTALQPKAPFIAAAAAIEGYEQEWADSNTSRLPALIYNHVDADGTPIPQPQRSQPPIFPTAFAQQSAMARDDLQAAFGMYKSNLGAPSNAISGRAKMQDQREGDTANFHYIDNLARSIRHVGTICLGAIPVVYDTERVARILGLDGTPSQVIIDPQAPQAYQQRSDGKVVINPAIGCYDVTVATGPAYATLRQEAAEQMGELIKGNPQAFQLLGDLWVKMQDWPEAEVASARLKAGLPPQIANAGSEDSQQNPQLQQAMQHIQQLTQQLQQVQGAAQQMDAKLKEKANNETMQLRIEAYKAETDRLKVVPSAQAIQQIVMETAQALLGQPTPLSAPGQGQMPQMPPQMPPGGPPLPPQGPPQGMASPQGIATPQQPQPAPAGFSLPPQGMQ